MGLDCSVVVRREVVVLVSCDTTMVLGCGLLWWPCAHGNGGGTAAADAAATHQQSHEAYVTDRFHETILAVNLCVAVNLRAPSTSTSVTSNTPIAMSPSLPCKSRS